MWLEIFTPCKPAKCYLCFCSYVTVGPNFESERCFEIHFDDDSEHSHDILMISLWIDDMGNAYDFSAFSPVQSFELNSLHVAVPI